MRADTPTTLSTPSTYATPSTSLIDGKASFGVLGVSELEGESYRSMEARPWRRAAAAIASNLDLPLTIDYARFALAGLSRLSIFPEDIPWR